MFKQFVNVGLEALAKQHWAVLYSMESEEFRAKCSTGEYAAMMS